MKKIFIKAAALFLVASVFVCNTTNAQNIKTYSGEMKVPLDLKSICSPWHFDYSSIKVVGEYRYYENEDEDRIWHGKFTLASNRIGYKDQVLTGNYTHGKKNGKFVIGEVENNKPTGIGMVINYKMGVLDGVYTYVDNSSFFTDYDSGSFKNGLIIGKIIYRKSVNPFSHALTGSKIESVMEGVVGANGRPEGVWTITTTGEIPMAQKRYFHNGRLICIEERDKSTGERYLCYCVFDGLTKAPDMSLIRDTIVEGKEVVVYNGQSAMLVKDNLDNYNSKMEKNMLGHYCVSAAIPEHLTALDSTVRKQAESWEYTYSLNEYKEYLANQERLRQERRKDSIRAAEMALKKAEQARKDSVRAAEMALKKAEKARNDSIRIVNSEIDYLEKLWKDHDFYMQRGKELKRVKNVSVNGNEIVLQTDDFTISGIFREENLLMVLTERIGSIVKSEINRQEIINALIQKYHVRIAASEDGKKLLFYKDDEKKIPELLIMYDILNYRSSYYKYIIPSKVGKKIQL